MSNTKNHAVLILECILDCDYGRVYYIEEAVDALIKAGLLVLDVANVATHKEPA
jgi:hypothetical protein